MILLILILCLTIICFIGGFLYLSGIKLDNKGKEEVDRNKEFKDFCELYNKIYPNDGPSISLCDHEEYVNGCGGWHCLFLQMKQKVPSKGKDGRI